MLDLSYRFVKRIIQPHPSLGGLNSNNEISHPTDFRSQHRHSTSHGRRVVTEFGTYSSDVTISSLKGHDRECEDITIDILDTTSVACQIVPSTVSVDVCRDSAKENCAVLPEEPANLVRESTQLPVLRSYRSRKCRSVSEPVEKLDQRGDGDDTIATAPAQSHEKRKERRVSYAGRKSSDLYPNVDLVMMFNSINPSQSMPHNQYNNIEVNSAFELSFPPEDQCIDCMEPSLHSQQSATILSAFHLVDRKSGVVFKQVYQGGDGQAIQTEAWEQRDEDSDLSFRYLPVTQTAGTHHSEPSRLATLKVPVPSMMLTFPTPEIPGSPVFVVQSPITISKFVSASLNSSTSQVASSARQSPVPTFSTCGHCGVAEFEAGRQCRKCDAQWLACKIWYQAHNGGERRWLMEPYIKPAESNAKNRAVMGMLGVAGGTPSSDRLDLGEPQDISSVPEVRTSASLLPAIRQPDSNVEPAHWMSGLTSGHSTLKNIVSGGAHKLSATVARSRGPLWAKMVHQLSASRIRRAPQSVAGDILPHDCTLPCCSLSDSDDRSGIGLQQNGRWASFTNGAVSRFFAHL